MIVAGAGALFIASYLGSTKEAYSYVAWKWTYIVMALTMLVGIVTTILRPEPASRASRKEEHTAKDYTRFFMLFIFIVLSFIFGFIITADFISSSTDVLEGFLDNKYFASFLMGTVRLVIALGLASFVAYIMTRLGFVNKKMVKSAYISPVENFFSRYGTNLALLLLSLVGLYRISDIVLGVIANVFFQDLGFTKIQIASVVKTFGLIMTIVGGFLGGILSVRFGVIKILFLGALLSAATNLLFMLLASMGNDMTMLYLVISADNLSAGLASAAFVAFLSNLTEVSFTAVQFAIFTSLMTLLPKVLGGYSGIMVDSLGYPGFFTITALMGVPVLFIVWIAGKKLNLNEQ
jgi:PAT family beta-lactamase induction signal transducer AmpG